MWVLETNWKSRLLWSFQTYCGPFQESRKYLRYCGTGCVPGLLLSRGWGLCCALWLCGGGSGLRLGDGFDVKL